MEVDQILMDLPAPPSHLSTASHPRNHLGKTLVLSPRYRDNRSLDNDLEGIQKEEQQLQVGFASNQCIIIVIVIN